MSVLGFTDSDYPCVILILFLSIGQFLDWIWKESLNSDGHHSHKYQQNEQSPLILTELTEHKQDVGNPGPGWGQAKKCGRVKLINGIPTPPL